MTLEKSTVFDNELSCSRDDDIHHRVPGMTASPLQFFISLPRQPVGRWLAEDDVEDVMRQSLSSIPSWRICLSKNGNPYTIHVSIELIQVRLHQSSNAQLSAASVCDDICRDLIQSG